MMIPGSLVTWTALNEPVLPGPALHYGRFEGEAQEDA
jgi:hypothetical protein